MNDPKLTVGAALTIPELESKKDWLISEQRDLEVQGFYRADILDNWREHVDTALKALDGYEGRMGIHGPNPSVTFAPMDPAVAEVIARRFMQALEACEALGATHMVVHSPFIFLGNPALPHVEKMGQDRVFEIAHNTMKEVVPMAENVGCTIVIENIWDKVPGVLLDLIRSFNSERVRLSIDLGHAYIGYKAGGAPPDYWVREGGPLLEHLHLQDTDGHSDRHWLPGAGEIQWDAVFFELNALNHLPRMILEVKQEWRAGDGLEKTVEWFKQKGWAK